MGFFDRLWPFSRAAASKAPIALLGPSTSDVAKSLGEQLASVIGSYTLPRRGSWELLRAYADLPWLHGCVRRRAEAIASVEWVLYQAPKTPAERRGRLPGQRNGAGGMEMRHARLKSALKKKQLVQLDDHPVLTLLEDPMGSVPVGVPRIHGPAWWELLSTWMDLVGEAPIGKDGPRDKNNYRTDVPDELTPVLPNWILKVPTKESPTFSIVMPVPITVAPRDMIWIRHVDPSSPYTGRGVGTALPLADELETDEYMSAAARARFFNGATPDFILGIKRKVGNITKEQAAAIAKDIEDKHQGPDKAGRFHVLGDDFRVEQLGHTLIESQYIDGRKFLRDTCMQVFGVPPEVLGVLESSNKSTIAAASDHFARYSTVPMLERFRVALQTELVTEFGDDLVLDYISPVPTDVENEWRVMIALPSAFTLNDIREQAGKPPLKEGGDALYSAPGAVPVEGKKPAKAPTEPESDKPDPETEVPDEVPPA